MQTLFVRGDKKLKLNQEEIEKKLKVKLLILGKKVSISGKEENIYIADQVIQALDFGFQINDALLLADENYVFQIIDIKAVSKRKNRECIRGRVIGSQGRTLQTLEDLSNSRVALKDNDVAIIAPAEQVKCLTLAICSLIRGSKQSNVYSFLEKHQPKDLWDLGIKKGKEEKEREQK